jgi:heat shock protein HslJ
VLLSLGCTKTKPQPVPAVVKKLSKPGELKDDQNSEFDEGVDYSTPSKQHRDLPLAGTKWEWQGISSVDNFEISNDHSRYSLEFKPNGWFDFQADCKRGKGMYEANGQRIALAVIRKAGRVSCRQGSQADDFLKTLENAKSFNRAENKLYIELKHDSKSMVFGLRP